MRICPLIKNKNQNHFKFWGLWVKSYAGRQIYIVNLHRFFKRSICWKFEQMLRTYCKWACAFLQKNFFFQICCFSELRNISDYHSDDKFV